MPASWRSQNAILWIEEVGMTSVYVLLLVDRGGIPSKWGSSPFLGNARVQSSMDDIPGRGQDEPPDARRFYMASRPSSS